MAFLLLISHFQKNITACSRGRPPCLPGGLKMNQSGRISGVVINTSDAAAVTIPGGPKYPDIFFRLGSQTPSLQHIAQQPSTAYPPYRFEQKHSFKKIIDSEEPLLKIPFFPRFKTPLEEAQDLGLVGHCQPRNPFSHIPKALDAVDDKIEM